MEFNRQQFAKQAKASDMKVTFRKVDNSIREMRCTLRPEVVNPTLKGGSRNTDPRDVTPVYDLDAKSWRSFRNDRVISVEVL